MGSTSSPSSSFPYQQQQSEDVDTSPGSSSSWGSIGPFFAVISVLTILAIISCFIGRICKARSSVTLLESIKHSDFLEWLRRKCCFCASNDYEGRVSANKAMAVGQTDTNNVGKAAAVAPDADAV